MTKSLSAIRLVAFDIDGVFTDGRFYLSDQGVESKAFNTQDGYGIRCLIKAGIQVAVISGRSSGAVAKRMQELGVHHIIQGCRDKIAAFDDIVTELGISDGDCAYVGDDIPDLATGLGCFTISGVPSPPECAAFDVDQDGDVDGSDLAAFSADFGRTDCLVGDPCEGDMDQDGDVVDVLPRLAEPFLNR